MIQVQNITKSFDGFRALDDLSFTVPHGAVYGLVGPNGAGKSTVLRCITGIYRPDAGTVSVGGLPVWENPAVKRRMAFIPDDLSAHAGDSIREMAGLMQKLYPRFDLSRYGQLREVFQLDEKKPLRRFSKGMQKQAAFWLAICAKPDYLILDERVDGLDPVMRRQIWSIILEDVAAHETTVLVSSHNLRELEDVCDHVGVMHHGKLLLERSLSDLQDNMVKVQRKQKGAAIAAPPGRGNNVGGGYPAGVSGTSRVFHRCIAGNGSGYFRDFFVLFRFCCLSVLHAPNVGIVDLHSLWCMLGPFYFLFMHHDLLDEEPQQLRR